MTSQTSTNGSTETEQPDEHRVQHRSEHAEADHVA